MKHKKYPLNRKCKICGGRAVLIEPSELGYLEYIPYYYHHSRDYSKGCHQRIGVYKEDEIKTLTTWTKDDEINALTEEVRNMRECWIPKSVLTLRLWGIKNYAFGKTIKKELCKFFEIPAHPLADKSDCGGRNNIVSKVEVK